MGRLLYEFCFAPPVAGMWIKVTDEQGVDYGDYQLGTEVGKDGAVRVHVPLPLHQDGGDRVEGAYLGQVIGWRVPGVIADEEGE